MAQEIERKYLIQPVDWSSIAEGIPYQQGYIATQNNTAIRVRIAGDRAFLTLKGETLNISRLEFEYEIPIADAQQLLENFCKKPFIEKTRYKIQYANLTWDIDIFEGENDGLAIAEVELDHEDQPIDLPPWIDREVTGDPKYYNSALANNPYQKWQNKVDTN